MNTVTAARFYGPYHENVEGGSGQGPALYDLNVKIAESETPDDWIIVLGQVGMGSVNTIKNAKIEASE